MSFAEIYCKSLFYRSTFRPTCTRRRCYRFVPPPGVSNPDWMQCPEWHTNLCHCSDRPLLLRIYHVFHHFRRTEQSFDPMWRPPNVVDSMTMRCHRHDADDPNANNVSKYQWNEMKNPFVTCGHLPVHRRWFLGNLKSLKINWFFISMSLRRRHKQVWFARKTKNPLSIVFVLISVAMATRNNHIRQVQTCRRSNQLQIIINVCPIGLFPLRNAMTESDSAFRVN